MVIESFCVVPTHRFRYGSVIVVWRQQETTCYNNNKGTSFFIVHEFGRLFLHSRIATFVALNFIGNNKILESARRNEQQVINSQPLNASSQATNQKFHIFCFKLIQSWNRFNNFLFSNPILSEWIRYEKEKKSIWMFPHLTHFRPLTQREKHLLRRKQPILQKFKWWDFWCLSYSVHQFWNFWFKGAINFFFLNTVFQWHFSKK